MLSKNNSRTLAFIGVLLIVSIALLLIRHFLEPRYLGYTKEHWLEVYGQDFFSRSYMKAAPLSPEQLEAKQAYRFFNKEGIDFLVEIASRNDNLSVAEITFHNLKSLLPWNNPWKSQKRPNQEYRHKIYSAKNLLRNLGMPYNWAENYVGPLLKSDEPLLASLGLDILSCSTNQLDKVANHASKFIGHPDSLVHHFAQIALAKTGRHAAIGIPKLIESSPHYTLSGWILLKDWAPTFEEIHEVLDQGMQSSDRLVSFKSTVVKMSLSDNPSHEVERIYSMICDEFDPNNGQGWSGMLGTLKSWPYSIEPLIPVLLKIVNEHDETVVHIAEIFAEHQIDTAPLHSKLYLALKGPNSNFMHNEADLSASLFLLQTDLNDQKVWDHFNNIYTPGGRNTFSDPRILDQIIAALAPFSSNAKAIFDRHPIFQKEYSVVYTSAARSLLRKRTLLPPSSTKN